MCRRKGLARPPSPFPVFLECQLHCSQWSNLRYVKPVENSRFQVTSRTTDPPAEKLLPKINGTDYHNFSHYIKPKSDQAGGACELLW